MTSPLRQSMYDEAEATRITNRVPWCEGAQFLGFVCIVASAVLIPLQGLWSAICLGFGFLLMVVPIFWIASFTKVKREASHFLPDNTVNRIAGAIELVGVACLVAAFVASMTMLIAFPASSSGLKFIALAGGTGTALLIPAIVLRMRQKVRAASLVRAHNFLICPRCHYDLRHLAEEGACPECGEPYRYDELPRIWKQGLGMPHFTPEEELRWILDNEASPEENQRFVAEDEASRPTK